MRSCDSDSISSYGVIPVSRIGTFERSSSIPTPPREHISNVEDVNPAAPMSWMATTASPWRTSRTASRTSFSANGSPTWTVGRRWDFASSKTSDAIDAPWIPSRPVFEPAYRTGFPGPAAFARKMRSWRTSPTAIAFTRMFLSKAG